MAPRSSRNAWFLLVVALAVACQCGKHSRSGGGAGDRLEPIAGESWLVDLDVPGFGEAKLTLPLGATTPRPVVVALHGDRDRPEWQCGTWRGIAGDDAFVLCPRGVPVAGGSSTDPRFTFASPTRTAAELRAALQALKERYGTHVAPGSVVLTGLGIGAGHATALLREEPSFFSRAVLISGAAPPWSATEAAAFVQRGGQRILFVCVRRECEQAAVRNVLFLERVNGYARLAAAGAKARGFDAHLADVIRKQWSWLSETKSAKR